MTNQSKFSGRTNYHGNEISWKLSIDDGMAEVTINQQGFNAQSQTTDEVPPIHADGDTVRYYMAVLLTHFVRSYSRNGFVSPSMVTVNR